MSKNYNNGVTSQLKYNPIFLNIINKKHFLSCTSLFRDNDLDKELYLERYKDVRENFIRHGIESNSLKFLLEIKNFEIKNEKELCDLAINTIKKEFNITNQILFDVKLINNDIDYANEMIKVKINKKKINKPNYSEEYLVKLINKRKIVNSIIQGSAMKYNHIFHLVLDDLNLSNSDIIKKKYSQLIDCAEHEQFYINDIKYAKAGGFVQIIHPTYPETRYTIKARSVTFPILIHELVKGVMEIISMTCFGDDKELNSYIINESDIVQDEIEGMILGTQIWTRLTNLIDINDFELKHQIFYELVNLPLDEFEDTILEIIKNTEKGKNLINKITKNIKSELVNELLDND